MKAIPQNSDSYPHLETPRLQLKPDNFKVEKAYSTNKPHNITPISKK